MRVTLDSVPYREKPTGSEIGRITKRMQRSGYSDVAPDELIRAISSGCTFVGAAFEPSEDGWGKFVSQQVFGLDFDNTGKHHEPLYWDDCYYIYPEQAISRFKRKIEYALLAWYPTMSSTPERTKFRMLVDFGEPIEDEEFAKSFIAYLLSVFPEADQACKNVNRLFFPPKGGTVIDLRQASH